MMESKNTCSDYCCIILAAGESRRMGKAKQLLPVEGKPLINTMVDRFGDMFRQLTVVQGAVDLRGLLGADRPGFTLTDNPDWRRGQLGSLQAGIRAGGRGPYCVILGDLPALRRDTVAEICTAADNAPAAYPVCNGRRGHPVILSSSAASLILAAAPGERAMRIIAPLSPMEIPVDDPGIHRDIDSPEDYRRYAD